MAKVSLSLDTRANKKGEYAIRKTIYSAEQGRKNENTGIYIKKGQWDAEKKRIINHPAKDKLNQELQRILLTLNDQVIIKKIVAFTEVDRMLYTDVLKRFMAHKKTVVKESTLKQYNGEIGKLAEFRQPKYFDEINGEFLQQYHGYMLNTLDNKQNTIWKTTKFLKNLFNYAIERNIILAKNDPFKEYKRPKYEKVKRDNLTGEEVTRIKQGIERGLFKGAAFDAAVWFVFACYTGMRFEDIMKHEPAKVAGDFITEMTEKQNSLVSVPLVDELKKSGILEHLKQVKKRANQDTNRALKVVAAICQIDKNMTFHVARHTFGTQLSRLGISIEVARELLGHADIKTTQIYYKVESDRIKKELKNFGYNQ